MLYALALVYVTRKLCIILARVRLCEISTNHLGDFLIKCRTFSSFVYSDRVSIVMWLVVVHYKGSSNFTFII